MAMWNPWRGCRRYSEGCRYCYLHKSDLKKGIDTEHVIKTRNFYAPIAKKRSGADTIVSGQVVYLCFSSDFLIEDADPWRNECWQMIKARSDLHFIFLTKRIERFMDCVPPDWGNGYDNVTVGCTVENQACADVRLSIFHQLPIKHKNIICQPLLDAVDLTPYLEQIELVVVGGESDRNARPLDYSWVLRIREQCLAQGVHFQFRQCGTHFIKDDRTYTLPVRFQSSQAKKANINF